MHHRFCLAFFFCSNILKIAWNSFQVRSQRGKTLTQIPCHHVDHWVCWLIWRVKGWGVPRGRLYIIGSYSFFVAVLSHLCLLSCPVLYVNSTCSEFSGHIIHKYSSVAKLVFYDLHGNGFKVQVIAGVRWNINHIC